MRILVYLLLSVLNLVAVAIDLGILLILVRQLRSRIQSKYLAAIDAAGRPVVDRLMETAERLWAHVQPARRLSTQGRLVVALAVLATLRLMVSVLTWW